MSPLWESPAFQRRVLFSSGREKEKQHSTLKLSGKLFVSPSKNTVLNSPLTTSKQNGGFCLRPDLRTVQKSLQKHQKVDEQLGLLQGSSGRNFVSVWFLPDNII